MFVGGDRCDGGSGSGGGFCYLENPTTNYEKAKIKYTTNYTNNLDESVHKRNNTIHALKCAALKSSLKQLVI
jgi:hypothetical protein